MKGLRVKKTDVKRTEPFLCVDFSPENALYANLSPVLQSAIPVQCPSPVLSALLHMNNEYFILFLIRQY